MTGEKLLSRSIEHQVAKNEVVSQQASPVRRGLPIGAPCVREARVNRFRHAILEGGDAMRTTLS